METSILLSVVWGELPSIPFIGWAIVVVWAEIKQCFSSPFLLLWIMRNAIPFPSLQSSSLSLAVLCLQQTFSLDQNHNWSILTLHFLKKVPVPATSQALTASPWDYGGYVKKKNSHYKTIFKSPLLLSLPPEDNIKTVFLVESWQLDTAAHHFSSASAPTRAPWCGKTHPLHSATCTHKLPSRHPQESWAQLSLKQQTGKIWCHFQSQNAA